MNQQSPLFRCSKCGNLNYERKKMSLLRKISTVNYFENRTKCEQCGKYCQEKFDTLYLKTQTSSGSGSSLEGLIVDEIIVISEPQTGQSINILTYGLRSMHIYRNNEEMMEVEHQEGKIVGKIKNDINFWVKSSNQLLTVKQDDIQSITIDLSFSTVFGGLFEQLGTAIEEIQETPQEEIQERLEKGVGVIKQFKQAMQDIGIKMPASESTIKYKQSELELEKTKTQIEQERAEQVKFRSQSGAGVETEAQELSPLEITEQKIAEIKARGESLAKVKQAYQDDIANTQDPDVKEMKKNMWQNIMWELMEE